MPPAFAQQVIFLYTRDLAGTAAWYARTLGLPQVLDQGACRIFRTSATSFIGVCSRPDRVVEPRGVVVTLVSDDVDGWHARLVAAGVAVAAPPRLDTETGIYAFLVRDPNGYVIEIQEFRDPRWPRAANASGSPQSL
ncbi:MAG: VOC family protein [Alphaproteobacteria bacterium]|nr:VOC family protein [Alphaproteobacteria bacterium]